MTLPAQTTLPFQFRPLQQISQNLALVPAGRTIPDSVIEAARATAFQAIENAQDDVSVNDLNITTVSSPETDPLLQYLASDKENEDADIDSMDVFGKKTVLDPFQRERALTLGLREIVGYERSLMLGAECYNEDFRYKMSEILSLIRTSFYLDLAPLQVPEVIQIADGTDLTKLIKELDEVRKNFMRYREVSGFCEKFSGLFLPIFDILTDTIRNYEKFLYNQFLAEINYDTSLPMNNHIEITRRAKIDNMNPREAPRALRYAQGVDCLKSILNIDNRTMSARIATEQDKRVCEFLHSLVRGE